MSETSGLPGPRFVQYFTPVLEALLSLGSSARPKEVYDWIARNKEIPRAELEGTTKGGQSRFENKVGWARFYLAKAGFIDTERRGVWVLTESGRNARLSHADAYELFRRIHEGFPRTTSSTPTANSLGKAPPRTPAEPTEATVPDEKAYVNQDEVQEELVRLLRSLSDKGFEELCARLLRHIGFENVSVTGATGDQGVDGVGHLIINRFVRTKVMFQCKRYEKTVGPDKIRDFRGAIQGRAERGIFMTTGNFTRGAIEEAARENTTAIELVDIDRLMDLLIEEGLGVKESKALSIEIDFFRPYLRADPSISDR